METQFTIHNSWAKFYDFVCEQSFGSAYQALTNNTISAIKGILPDKGAVLDLGAGTGRITIPLAKQGYELFPVEISTEMSSVLTMNLIENQLKSYAQNNSIAGFKYEGLKADMAVCVFTVLIYITSKEEMVKSIQNVAAHLKPGGLFFFDIASQQVFQGGIVTKANFRREIEITRTEGNIYTYKEECNGMFNNESFSYTDEFPIRCWSKQELISILTDFGFEDTNENFYEFAGTGSEYKLFRKK